MESVGKKEVEKKTTCSEEDGTVASKREQDIEKQIHTGWMGSWVRWSEGGRRD